QPQDVHMSKRFTKFQKWDARRKDVRLPTSLSLSPMKRSQPRFASNPKNQVLRRMLSIKHGTKISISCSRHNPASLKNPISQTTRTSAAAASSPYKLKTAIG